MFSPFYRLGNGSIEKLAKAQGHTVSDSVKIQVQAVWMQRPDFTSKLRDPGPGPIQHGDEDLACLSPCLSNQALFISDFINELIQVKSDFHKLTELINFVGKIYLVACCHGDKESNSFPSVAYWNVVINHPLFVCP
jgi:hypothetical protein